MPFTLSTLQLALLFDVLHTHILLTSVRGLQLPSEPVILGFETGRTRSAAEKLTRRLRIADIVNVRPLLYRSAQILGDADCQIFRDTLRRSRQHTRNLR